MFENGPYDPDCDISSPELSRYALFLAPSFCLFLEADPLHPLLFRKCLPLFFHSPLESSPLPLFLLLKIYPVRPHLLLETPPAPVTCILAIIHLSPW